MKRIAIIPARGGSKRIPRKNIKDFLGKPIIAYSIETALNSNLFDEVMVSTDDQEIKAVAEKYGAKVPFMRSVESANDFASTYDVLEEVLLAYKNKGIQFEYGCCIYPTAPFVTKALLTDGYNLMVEKTFDSVFPVVAFSYPIQRALKVNEGGGTEMFQPQFLNARSQDVEKAFHDAGQFYWFNTAALLEKKRLWTNHSGVVECSALNVQDIDHIEDWNLAELKYKLRKGEA